MLLQYSLLFAAAAGLALGDGDGPPMSHAQIEAEERAEARNQTKMKHTLIILGAMASAVVLYRLTIYSVRYVRTLTCLNNSSQKYFKMPSPLFASIKQHILYAPLFRKRHHQEFRLFNLNFGVLPSRFQTLFFAGVIAMNVAHCVRGIPWSGPEKSMLGQLRNRTGSLAIVNMIPLVIMAGRNNPLIVCLDISFDNFNLIHRLFGRIVIVQAFVHAISQLLIVVHSGLF